MNAPDSYRDFVRDLLGICSRCPHSSQGQALHQLVREIETFACKARDKLDRASVDQRTSAATPAAPAQVGAQPAGRAELLESTLRWGLDGVQEWCDAVGRGTSWDSWDDHYKAFCYGDKPYLHPGLKDARAVLNATSPTAGAVDDGEIGR